MTEHTEAISDLSGSSNVFGGCSLEARSLGKGDIEGLNDLY